MEKTIDGTTYRITPIPPSLSPYATLLAKLLRTEPSTIEEAEKLSGEIDGAMQRLLEETVSPSPKKEHYIQLYNAVINVTADVLRDAKFFRKPKGLGSTKSGANGASNPSTPK